MRPWPGISPEDHAFWAGLVLGAFFGFIGTLFLILIVHTSR